MSPETGDIYRTIFENTGTAMLIIEENTIISLVNTEFELLSGYSKEEIEGKKSWTEFVVQKDLARLKNYHQMRRGGMGIAPRNYEAGVVDRFGNVKDIYVTVAMIPGTKKSVASFIDINDRKQTEKALRRSEEKYRMIFDNSPLGIIHFDQNGTVTACNDKFLELMGASEEAVIGLNMPADLKDEMMKSAVREALSGRVGLYEGNYLSVAGNKLTPLKATLSRITADVGEFVGAVGIFEDITEKKKMEEHLLRVEKLESVGLLAGGIAHDFNNILTVITGNVALAKMKAGTIDDDYRVAVLNVLTEAEKASLQAKDLTQQLLTFARGGAPILKTASMTELLKDTTGFALRGSNVRCKFNIPEDLWPVKIDVGQINQVIHNLIINADQAMPEGGIIKVGAANLTISEEHNLPLAAGEYVKISLEDQGIGIPEEHLSKIFDPYFTTKQKGTGLGLTTSYSIIRKHEGYITVESELGVGTTFHVYLQASPQESLKYKNQEEKAFSGKGKILVMDDEKMLRYVVGEMLTHIGYEVACTKDGAEAVELYKKSKAMNNPFDAVIMDLTIPGGMGGKEAVKKLIEIDPDVRAIVSSGYSNDPVMANYPEYGFKAVVAKPYSIEELGKVLESVIS